MGRAEEAPLTRGRSELHMSQYAMMKQLPLFVEGVSAQMSRVTKGGKQICDMRLIKAII